MSSDALDPDGDLPQLPFERPNVLDVSPLYRTLQLERPVARVRTDVGDVAWLVTGYEEARRLFADERLGRTHPEPERAARISRSVLGGPCGDYETEKASDQRMRRLLTPAFSARRMRALRDHVQELVDGTLDRMATLTPPVDLHKELSFPLPVLVICELLGVPYADRDQFRVWADEVAGTDDLDSAAAGLERLIAYMHGLIEKKRRSPEEDVISDLAAASTAENVGDDEIAGLATAMLVAGHETTVARIDVGAVLLLTHPEQAYALRRHPALVPSAVEEILRLAAPNDHGQVRYAHADVDIGDVIIHAGDAISIMPNIANRDERIFPDPDRLVIPRRSSHTHVAFGYGQHFCIGAHLARVELQAVFGSLFQRFPTLRLAVPFDELRQPAGRVTGGVAELPVTWERVG